MRRRWLQFSLSGFLLTTSAFAVWLGLVAEKAMRQKESVARFEDWGATIVYDHQWQGPAKSANLKAAAPGWLWLRHRLGPHFFDKVASVELVSGNRQFTAVELTAARLGRVPALPRALELKDIDFNALGYLPDLKRLTIIGDLNVTHAGIRRLGRLKRLEVLILDNTSGRSKGGITDESVAFIERMPRLTELYLEGSHITDEGLAGIRWPAGLRDLDLSGTPITDAGLEHLTKIATLHRLVVLDTRVSAAAVKRFQSALPDCRVLWRRFQDDK